MRVDSLLHGGHQEWGHRAATENVAGVVGMATALELRLREMGAEAERLTALRERLFEGLAARIDHVTLNGHPTQRLASTLNVCFEYVEGEAIIMGLDLAGVAVSSGSACTSASLEPSHVLLAMGAHPAVAQGSIRFSLGRDNTEVDVDYVVETLPPIVERLRAMSMFSEQSPFPEQAGPRPRRGR
jgi:cysteine desulfurase